MNRSQQSHSRNVVEHFHIMTFDSPKYNDVKLIFMYFRFFLEGVWTELCSISLKSTKYFQSIFALYLRNIRNYVSHFPALNKKNPNAIVDLCFILNKSTSLDIELISLLSWQKQQRREKNIAAQRSKSN